MVIVKCQQYTEHVSAASDQDDNMPDHNFPCNIQINEGSNAENELNN